MLKYIISAVAIIGMSSVLSAQVELQASPNLEGINNQSPFLDASGYTGALQGIGKGLYFPRTDLTQFSFVTDKLGQYQFFKTGFDGMVVYNTGTGRTGSTAATQGIAVDVTPGFYYFSNPTATEDTTDVSTGRWVRIGGADLATGIANGNFWSLLGNSGTTAATIGAGNAITGGNWIGTTDATSLTVGTNSIARLNIGAIPENVGGEDFDFVMKVYGKAKFDSGIVTANSTYPDYVFDNYFTGTSAVNPSYKFRTLAETEQFIKENNHLPGVTKIDELKKENGQYLIDNTQLSIQSLEKVEELYLHTIEQQKQIDALKAEIAELKTAFRK